MTPGLADTLLIALVLAPLVLWAIAIPLEALLERRRNRRRDP